MANANKMGAPGFQTVQQVVDIQNALLQRVSGQQHTSSLGKHKNLDLQQYIIQKEKEKLIDLWRELKQLEQGLFAKFGLGITDYRSFIAKTKEWHDSGAAALLEDTSLQNKIVSIMEEGQDNDFKDALTIFVNNFTEKERYDWPSIFDKEVKEAIEKIIEYIPSGVSKSVQEKSLGGKDKGLTTVLHVKSKKGEQIGFQKWEKGITFFQYASKKNNNDVEYDIRFTSNMPVGFKKKLTDGFLDFIKINEKDKKINITDFREQSITKITLEIIKHLPEQAKGISRLSISEAIEKYLRTGKLDINRNPAVIKGMLGELYWLAFFEYIGLGKKANTIFSTGLSLKSSSGKQTPTDIVLEEMGFQVKHYYKTEQGFINFHGYGENIAREESLADVFGTIFKWGSEGINDLGRFYFSKSYNKVNEEIKSNKVDYQKIYNRFNPINTSLKTYVRSNIATYLNFRDIELHKDTRPELKNIKAGKPVMFFINDKPLLSSALIFQAIESLSSQGRTNNLIYLKVEDLSIISNESALNESQAKWNDFISPPSDYLSRLKEKANFSCKYRLEVNLDELVKWMEKFNPTT